MIELKVEKDEGRNGNVVSCSVDGTGIELIVESHAAITGLISSLKQHDRILYEGLMVLMADNDEWMCKDEAEDRIAERLSRLTDKNVIS